MSSDGAQSTDQSSTKVGAQPVVVASKIEVSPTLIVSQLVVTQLVFSQSIMSSKQYKILGKLLRLSLQRFSDALDRDAYVFLIAYEDRLHNLGLIETPSIE